MGFPRFSGHFPVVFSPVVIIGALGSTALAANEFLLRSTLAVPGMNASRAGAPRPEKTKKARARGSEIQTAVIGVLLMSY